MKLSQNGIGVTRLENLDKEFPAQAILMQTGQLAQYGAGIFGYNNIPLLVKRNIENIVRDILNKYGCIEVELPTLQPENMWQESGRWDKYIEDGTMLVVETEKGKFCLAPTAEEAVVELAKKKVKSYKDIPVVFYQIGEKYRNEIRNRGYLLRGKSFPMMDAYSFDLDDENLVQTYENIKLAYTEIFNILGLNAIPVVADNGSIGGHKSEEYMVLSDLGEDTVLFDKESGRFLNLEVLEKENYKEYLKEEYGITNVSNLEERKALELGHIFQLGTKYSKSMNATYINKDGKEVPFAMGCYGIGITRLIVLSYEKNIVYDKNNEPTGFSLPIQIAPYIVQIIAKPDNPEKVLRATELYNILSAKKVPVIVDDRANVTLGSKIKDCKTLGTPYMIVLGDKIDVGYVELEKTATGEKVVMSEEDLISRLEELNRSRLYREYENVKEIF